MSHRVAATLCGLALTVTCLAAPVAPASAAPVATRITDVNCDKQPDLVSADPLWRSDEWTDPPWQGDEPYYGQVRVDYGNGVAVQAVARMDLGEIPVDLPFYQAAFGSALIAADLNRDGCSDVVVGDPAIDEVWVLWGSPSGISAGNAVRIPGVSGDPSFGYSLAFVPLPSPVLVVGTGNALRMYPVNADGSLGKSKLVTIDSPGIEGTTKDNAKFGYTMSASDDLLVVGSPIAAINGKSGAGAIHIMRLLPNLGYKAVRITQNTSGVQGNAEAGDEFGHSVSVFHGTVAVGVEHEGVGKVRAAGMVQPLQVSGSGTTLKVKALPGFTQDSAGVPGTSEEGDQFGSSVMVYRPCANVIGVMVASDGENDYLGAANMVPLKPTTTCKGKSLSTRLFASSPLTVSRTSQTGTAAETAKIGTGEMTVRTITGVEVSDSTAKRYRYFVLAPPAA